MDVNSDDAEAPSEILDVDLNNLKPAVLSETTYLEKNFRLGVVNGVLNTIGETLMDPTLVVVAFLSVLTRSPLILGLAVPLRDGAWAFPQFWVSGYLQNIPNKISVYRKLSYLRIAAWGILAATVNFVRDPAKILVTFLVIFTLSSLINGLAGLPFMEVVAKTIPQNRRGEFFAWRLAVGGLGSIGASILVKIVLDPAGPLKFPSNYGVLAAGYFVLATFGLLAFNRVQETADSEIQPRVSANLQFRRAIKLLKENNGYRNFVSMWSLLLIAGVATPFFAVYVQQQLGGSKVMIGVYLGVYTATNLLVNLLFGKISKIFGNVRIMVIANICGLIMLILVLLLRIAAGPMRINAQTASYLLIPVFALSGMRTSGIGVSGNSLMLDISPASERSLYVGFTNTLLGIVLISTGLGGLIMNSFGFQALVVVTILAHSLALVQGIRLQKNFRH
ncbi:MAG: MFS transporter [Anaerolineaceae bacterium]|nr:MFS transporter [Anaerolineaceae bacterium]